MSEKVIGGYLIRDASSFSNVEMIVNEMRQAVMKTANQSFKRFVEWQTARIVDEIVLCQIERPEGASILDVAVGEVKRRIIYAEKAMQETEFNLYIGIQAMNCSVDGKPAVFLKTIYSNEIYDRCFRKIKELESCDITVDDLKKVKGEKSGIYETLVQQYENSMPFTCSLINYDLLSFEIPKLKFDSVPERALSLAKEKVLNHLLACYACDTQIPPNKLMEYSTFAFRRVEKSDSQLMIEIEKKRLEELLPEMTQDMILSDGVIGHVPSPESSETESQKTSD